MIICDKCGAYNDEHRLICCECGQELVKPTHSNYIPTRENPPTSGKSSSATNQKFNNYSDSNVICSNCGTGNSKEMAYCFNCGRSLYGAGIIGETGKDKFIKSFFIGLAVVFVIAVILFLVLYVVSLFMVFTNDAPKGVNGDFNIACIYDEDLLT